MAREPWLSDELRVASVARLVFSRGLRRPVRVLAIALLATGALATARALAPPSYEATLYFRLVEGDLTDPRTAPRPPRDIRDYLSSVALSRKRVELLMRKYQWSVPYLTRNPVAAVDEFRDEVRIEVSRNYFLYDWRPGDPPRSAQVKISLAGPDPERTRAVVHEIGQAVLAEQSAQRSVHLAQARDLLETQLALARARARALQEAIGRLWPGANDPRARGALARRAQIAALEARRKAAIEQVVALERRAAATAFTAEAEAERLGLDFELFDESLVVWVPRLTPFQLARRAAIAFAIVLVLTVAVLGAFDDRLYAPEDLAARGLPLFGALPRFPGDDVGSYRARMSPERAPS